MKTRCPCCGTTLSLDALVAHESARAALMSAFRLSTDLGAGIVRYLALFRPERRDLSMERVARLLEEIEPDITAGRISRNGREYPAPPRAWVWAIGELIDGRDSGRLKLPLKSHGYLYEVLTSWATSPATAVVGTAPAIGSAPGASDWITAAIEAGFGLLAPLRMPRTPSAVLMPDTARSWRVALNGAAMAWTPEADAPRIRCAFERMAGSVSEWPEPAQFLRFMPARQAHALESDTHTPQARAANAARLAELVSGLGLKGGADNGA